MTLFPLPIPFFQFSNEAIFSALFLLQQPSKSHWATATPLHLISKFRFSVCPDVIVIVIISSFTTVLSRTKSCRPFAVGGPSAPTQQLASVKGEGEKK